MSNILQYASANKALNDIKQSLKSVGCDICDVDSLTDVSKVIKDQLVTGPNAVINASLIAGPGIKISPIDRKGYKISANDTALLSQDVSSELPKGMSIHKALFDIVHKIIPEAAAEAAYAPSVLDVTFVKVPYDGCDYYPLQGQHGSGRKAGLRPNTWYTRIILNSQSEPMYVDMGSIIAELRNELLHEALHLVDSRIEDALNKRLLSTDTEEKPKRPKHHEHPHFHYHEADPDSVEDTEDEDTTTDADCDLCKEDKKIKSNTATLDVEEWHNNDAEDFDGDHHKPSYKSELDKLLAKLNG